VDPLEYNRRINCCLGNIRVYNYYGMAEQLGSVFVECEYGHMHCSNYSDVIIRRPEDFSVADVNEPGLIELVSLLPTSYPGHALLTEDEGEILGIDDCPCGRLGKYFRIHGRIKGAELRGCSDTYECR
jgi:phenylacetate-coenzyme A ligase PaaK-like adenylate-forming protein